MLAPWKKSYDKPRQHIKKQKHHFADKGQSYVFFPVVQYGCESWTIKKTEHQRINAFELWCWRTISPHHQTNVLNCLHSGWTAPSLYSLSVNTAHHKSSMDSAVACYSIHFLKYNFSAIPE